MSSDIDNTQGPGTTDRSRATPDPLDGARSPRRWTALAALALMQFMLVLDSTVVNVALPSIRRDLDFSTTGLAWVVDGYALMAGGLLLLGGRLGDLLGRRRVFLAGVVLFAAASAASGAAPNAATLVAGRFVQGIGEALAAPSALALVAVMFTDRAERTKALGLWGGLAGLGGTLGVVLSGVITSELDWRWIFYISVPVAAAALILVPRLVPVDRRPTTRATLDVPGAALVTLSLTAAVYGLLEAAHHPWDSAPVAAPLITAALAAVLFVVVESRTARPLVPLSFFANRTRVSANATTVFLTSAFFAMFFLLTLFMQQVLGYSALKTGLAYLPFGLALIVGIGLSTALVPRLGVRTLLTLGFSTAAIGLFLLSRIGTGTTYAGGLLPGMLVLAAGNGMIFPALGNASMHQTTEQDAGLASGIQTTIQQLGGSLGLAVIVTAGTRHTTHLLSTGTAPPTAATRGYALGLLIAAIVVAAGVLASLVLVERTVSTDISPTS